MFGYSEDSKGQREPQDLTLNPALHRGGFGNYSGGELLPRSCKLQAARMMMSLTVVLMLQVLMLVRMMSVVLVTRM